MTQEAIEHWASEFLSSTPGEMQAQRVGERTGQLLVQFLSGACGSTLDPAELEQRNITDGIAIGLAPLQLTEAERNALPELLEEFLMHMENTGRLSAGATLAATLRVAQRAEPGSVLLAMLPDTGERYLSTFLLDDIPDGSDEEWLAGIGAGAPRPALAAG